MDINVVTQFISSFGFPIAMCVAMGWFVVSQTEKHRQDILGLNEQHKEEMNDVKKAIENNTIAVTKLCERLAGRD